MKNRAVWLRAGFVTVAVVSFVLFQLVNRRSMQVEAEACDFGHPIPGLVPDRLTIEVYAPILLATLLLPIRAAMLVIFLIVLCAFGMASYLVDPGPFFRECYGMGGESEDVTGIKGLVLMIIFLSFLCFVILAGYAAVKLSHLADQAIDRFRSN